MKETEAGLIFCGEKSYLSNLYPTKREHNGLTFHSSLQLYEWLRCIELDDDETADLIYDTTNALEVLVVAQNCWDSSKWRKHRIPAMLLCLSKMFRQRRRLRDLLRLTGSINLIECGTDSFWTGNASYEDPCWHSPSDLLGNNMIGALLTDLRAQFMLEFESKDQQQRPTRGGRVTL